MSIDGHKTVTGIGVSSSQHHWGPSGDVQVGASNFSSIMSQLGSHTQYIKFFGHVNILWQEYEPNEPLTITNVSNATPIEITTAAAHGKSTGNLVSITEVGGDNSAAANGFHRAITVTSSTTFTIDGTVGDGVYADGVVRTYDFTLLEAALTQINAQAGKGGVGLKAGLKIASKTFRPDTDPAPAWARVSPYEYTYTSQTTNRRKQLKVWLPAVRAAWHDLVEAVISKYKDDSRIAFWRTSETDTGDAKSQSGSSGWTDSGYLTAVLGELEAARRGDPLGNIIITCNFFLGQWGSSSWAQLLAKIEELTITAGTEDPIPYGKGQSDYNSDAWNLHRGFFKWMRDRSSTLPLGSMHDDTLLAAGSWRPPWQYVIDLPDPFPETAQRHTDFSSQVLLTTPDTAFYYCAHYMREHFLTMRWPAVTPSNGYITLTELRTRFKAALALYTDTFPVDPNYYQGGAVSAPLTEKNINLGGAEHTEGAITFEADVDGPTSGSWSFGSRPSVFVPGSTIGDEPYRQLVRLSDDNAGTHMEYVIGNVENGVWDINLYYTEGFYTSAGQRLFHFDLQGIRKQTSYDIYTEAGGKDTQVIDSYTIQVTNNQIVLRWTADEAAVDGFAEAFAVRMLKTGELTPAKKTVARVNIGSSLPHTTTDDRTFAADDEAKWTGGAVAARPGITVTTDTIGDAPYQTLRRGPTTEYMERVFSDLENGSDWTVKVYYIEGYWDAIDKRSFHLDLQGARKATDYDPYTEAGAKNDEVVAEYTGIIVADNTLTARWTPGTFQDPKSEVYAIELIKGVGGGTGSTSVFGVQRDILDIPNNSLTVTDTVTSVDTAKSFELLSGAQHTSSGQSSGTTGWDANNVTGILELTNSTTLTATRKDNPNGNTRLFYELVEYTGSIGGANEIAVRYRGKITLFGGLASDTASITGATDITKCVPFYSVNHSGTAISTEKFAVTAEILTGTNEVKVQRGLNQVNTDVQIVVVEFVGSNWTVQQNISHTFSATGADETETITDISDWTKCFISPSFRFNSAVPASTGVTVRPGSSTTTLRHRIEGGSVDGHVAISHVVKNTAMSVEHLDSITGGLTDLPAGDTVNPQTENRTVTAVMSLAESMLLVQATDSSTSGTDQKGFWQGRLTSTTNAEMWRAIKNGSSGEVVLQVVQLPQDGVADVIDPTVPQNLFVTVISATALRASADASTDDESGVDYYEWELDSVVQAGTSEIPQKDFTGLTEYTEYTVRVRAYDNAANVSGWSDSAVQRTADETAPTAPVINSVDVAGETQTFHITPSTDAGSGVVAYDFYDAGEFYISVAAVDFTIDGAEIVTDISSIEVPREWSVVGVDGEENESAFSVSFNVASGNAPQTPGNTEAIGASETSINVSWGASASATTYDLYLTSPSGTNDILIASVADTQYTETGLVAWQTHYYKVSATNANGESPKSAVFSGRTLDLTPPAGGSINSVEQVGATAVFDITPATDAGSGVAGYYLWNDIGEIVLGEPPYAIITDANPQADISFTGATYSWTIQPFDVAGNVGTMSAAFPLVAFTTYPDYPQSYDNDREPLDQVSWDRANGTLRGRVLHTKENYEFSIVHPYITDAQRQILDNFWTQNRGVIVNLVLQDTGETHQCYMRKRPKFIPIAYDGTDHSFKAIVEFIQ